MSSPKILPVLLLVLVGMAAAATIETDINVTPVDERVMVQVYLESLCPYCHELLTEALTPAMSNPEIWKIANFRLIPFGWTTTERKGNSWVFDCQHGDSECQGNMLFSCATGIYGDLGWYFVLCLESSKKRWNTDGPICANKLNMNWTLIKQCTNSAWGKQRMFLFGLESNYMNFKTVPHIRVNGIEDYTDAFTENPVKTLCLLYKGQEKIAACQNSQKL